MNVESTERMTSNRNLGGTGVKLASLIVAGILGTAATSQAYLLYQSDFTGADLASADLEATDGGFGTWVLDSANDWIEGSASGGNDRSNVYTTESWQHDGGFTLNVTFNNVTAQTRFSFGLVDAAYTISATGDWLNSDLPGAYGIGFSTAGSESSDFLGFNNDAGVRTVLSQAQGDATVGILQTMTITVTPTTWSYSLNGQTATTGSHVFDTSRSYVFTAHSQRTRNQYISNITLAADESIPTLSEWGMIILFLGLSGLAYRKFKAQPAEAVAAS